MTRTRTPLRLRRVAVVALALSLAACGTRQPAPPPSPEQRAAMTAELARQEARLAALAADTSEQAPIVTRVHFSRGPYRPGIEQLRVVRRQNTVDNVAAQVALNVALVALTRGVAAQSFSKDDLAGDEIPELAGHPAAVNPAMREVADGLGRVATRLYVGRAIEAVAAARTDGSTLADIVSAAQVPTDFGTALTPGGWHLVYENLAGSDELYRLKFGAELGRSMKGPVGCGHVSDPLPWAVWQADGWQRLREERARAVKACVDQLGAYITANW